MVVTTYVVLDCLHYDSASVAGVTLSLKEARDIAAEIIEDDNVGVEDWRKTDTDVWEAFTCPGRHDSYRSVVIERHKCSLPRSVAKRVIKRVVKGLAKQHERNMSLMGRPFRFMKRK